MIKKSGFTLIELSIVLVVVGLIIGGVVVGRDLISGAEIRSQISQIEQYITIVGAFENKYNALPGDMPPKVASTFGFWPRGGGVGTGDGNKMIQGTGCGAGWGGTCIGGGELLVFWSDLTYANGMNLNYITGSFPGPNASDNSMLGLAWSLPGVSSYFPSAKLGGGSNYVYVWSGGFGSNTGNPDSNNYFEITQISSINGGAWGGHGVTVAQAYAIDQKIDDGMPTTGNVQAVSVNGGWVSWSAADYNGGSWTYPGADSPTTCFNFTNVMYSMSQNNGAGVNCDLAFLMQ